MRALLDESQKQGWSTARLEAIAIRVEAVAIRVEAIAHRLEAITTRQGGGHRY